MQGHHLILGELVDFISGEILADTHDERYRQKLARMLVNQKGFMKKEINPRRELRVSAGKKNAIVKIDFEINVSGKIGMIIKYGPGSLVTRQRPALAASRLVAPYQIPMVVVTNGKDAEIIEGKTGKVVAHGLQSSSQTALQHIQLLGAYDHGNPTFSPLDEGSRRYAGRQKRGISC